MSPDNQNFGDDAALDRLLRQAHWDQPPPEAQGRLLRVWSELRAPRQERRIGAWSALAASVLIAAGMAWWIWQARQPEPGARRVFVMSNNPAQNSPVVVPTAKWDSVISRPANLAERLVIRSRIARPRAQVVHAEIPRQSSTQELIELLVPESSAQVRQDAMAALLRRGDRAGVEAVLSRLTDPGLRAEALAAVRAAANDAQPPLLAALNSPRVEHRFAAARALGELCQHGTAGDELRRMVLRNAHRREALAALMMCRDPDAAKFLETARTDPSINAEILALESQLSNTF